MNASFFHPCTLVRFAAAATISLATANADENNTSFIESIRKQADIEIAGADVDTSFKKRELGEKYIAALKNLAEKTAHSGDLDGVLLIREEIAAIEKDGAPTAHIALKSLVDLRAIYLKSEESLDSQFKVTRASLVRPLIKQVRDREIMLTKAGKIDEALELRKYREQLTLEYLSDEAVPFTEDPRLTAGVKLEPLPPITIPEFPAVAAAPPFTKSIWLESMTIPVAKQRIREQISIGDRGKHKWPLIGVPPGSVWNGFGSGRIFLSAGNLVSRKAKFEKLRIIGDLGSRCFFIHSELDNCKLERGGIWWGEQPAMKFYFEESLISTQFSHDRVGINDYGFRAERSVFVNLKMPEINYLKGQPADHANHPWMKFVHCRFVKCTLPASLLLMTRECVFDDCIFVDDSKDMAEKITRPFEVSIYIRNCRSRISKLPEPLKITEKSITALKGVVIPTPESIAAKASR